MADLTITEAFRAFGATLANHMWAYSAIAEDGSLVISFWAHHLKFKDRVLTYSDHLSRWKSNKPGGNLFVQHLRTALDQALPVRLVIATAEKPELVEQDSDATKIKKTYAIKEDVIGRVLVFDGDNVVVEFRHR